VAFAGLIVGAPQSILQCAHVSREFSIRFAVGKQSDLDNDLSRRLKGSSRIRQFSIALAEYLVSAGGLPKDIAKRTQAALFET
jgi:hypothetical protein